MATTQIMIEIDKDLLDRAIRIAERDKTSVWQLITDSLKKELDRREKSSDK